MPMTDAALSSRMTLPLTDAGAWSIVAGSQSGTRTTLASGNGAALGTMTWHHLDFSMKGSTLTASIDGNVVGSATDSTYSVGAAGLGVGLVSTTWFNVQFDNLAITPLGPLSTPFTDTLVNRATGLALKVAGDSTADGAQLDQGAPNGKSSQTWQLAGDRTGPAVLLNVNSGKAIGAGSGALDQESFDGGAGQHWALEAVGGTFYRLVSPSGLAIASMPTGTALALAPLDCASNAQQWSVTASPTVNATYTIVNHKTGWLIDVNAQSTTAGAAVIQWNTNGGANQEWRVQPTGVGISLLNGNSGLALAAGATGADQEMPSGAAGQVWTLSAASAGYYTLTSTGGALSSPSSTKGDQLSVTAPVSGSASQEWMFVPAL